MGLNPLALYAIADRLRQDPARWKCFAARRARRWLFKIPGHELEPTANAFQS